MRNIKNILIAVIIILVDLFVYFVLGTLLMSYDDFYFESKGVYWSLASMSTSEQLSYIGFIVWNGLNIIAAGYVIYRFVRKIRERNTAASLYKWWSKVS